MHTQKKQDAEADALLQALDTSRRQLAAAIQQNDELLEVRSLLTERVYSLEFELANAYQLAHYDDLTGLPNRRLLLDRFIQASAVTSQQRQAPQLPDQYRVDLAMLFFDMNDFKGVNDELGHDAGDELLKQVAARLSSSIRHSDTACRYGGDEFVVLLTEISNREHAVMALTKIRDRLAPPYLIDRHSVRMTVSNGMATYPEDAQNYPDLIRLSDRSMFRNKIAIRDHTDGAHKSRIRTYDAMKTPCFGR